MIPKKYIEELLANASIVDVIGDEITLKRSGTNYFATCPFHSARSADTEKQSFTVASAKNFYHCFGCGAHGSAIDFYMKFKALKFPEAVELLAQKVAFVAPPAPLETKTNKKTNEVSETLRFALDYYRRELRNSSDAISFLKNAGISGETAAKFQIGFAPSGWQNLEPLFGENYGARCVDAGIGVLSTKHGRAYDRFRERLIFPTMDVKGKVLGLVGMNLKPLEPIYLRSKKCVASEDDRAGLFGASQAEKSIRTEKCVVLVQDCMDVLKLYEYGFSNAMAAAETGRVRAQHIEYIFRKTSCLVCCFPNTKIGTRDAWNAMKEVLPALLDTVQVRFAMLPDGQSPSNVLAMDNGTELFKLIVKSAVPLSEFFLQTLVARHETCSIEGRAELMEEAMGLLASMKAPHIKMLLQEAVHDLVLDKLELLDSVDEHDLWLAEALDTATTELIIVSPWITQSGIRRFDLCGKIKAAIKRGVNVTIFTDVEFSDDRKKRYAAGELVEDASETALEDAGARLEFANRIHSKVVIRDSDAMCIGSFNWLSAAKAGKYKRHEVSLVYRQGNIKMKRDSLLDELRSRKPIHTELVP